MLLTLVDCCGIVDVIVKVIIDVRGAFVSRPMTCCHSSLGKTVRHSKLVVDFLRERDTFRNKIMETVEDFDEKKSQQQR